MSSPVDLRGQWPLVVARRPEDFLEAAGLGLGVAQPVQEVVQLFGVRVVALGHGDEQAEVMTHEGGPDRMPAGVAAEVLCEATDGALQALHSLGVFLDPLLGQVPLGVPLPLCEDEQDAAEAGLPEVDVEAVRRQQSHGDVRAVLGRLG
ncbi:MAG TPA: hypothetical protein VK694_03185 [Verrucomicrobiae bacterium]|nr:hypothetical protein [Verrucomicrobiae bacterium]